MSADSMTVKFSEGRGTNLGRAKNRTLSWRDFRALFRRPTRTRESLATYLKLHPDEQARLKGVDGWIFRTHVEKGRRKRTSGLPSDVFSIDFDYATPEFLSALELGLICPKGAFVVHSSRRHTSEKPRLRVWGLFSRPVDNDEYGAICRIIAHLFDPGMSMVDKVSFRPAQMMYKPTASADGEFVYLYNDGEPFDVDALLTNFEETVGSWRDISLLPHCVGETLRETADKAEDPTTKSGPVGNFCRAYDVPAAIDTFLADVYAPVDAPSEKPRYSYLHGSTTNGAVVEDDGLFLYSHHGSDPCSDMLVNAFDLVRIHKFGNLDDNITEKTPMRELPSWQAMVSFIAEDPLYKKQQAISHYDQTAMFDDVMDEYFEAPVQEPSESGEDDEDDPIGRVRHKTTVNKKPDPDWFPGELELDKNGYIIENLPNAQIIINNDSRLYGAIAYDDFMKRLVLRRSILSRMEIVPPAPCRDLARGDLWQDWHDTTVRAILAAPNGPGKKGYGMAKLANRDLVDAIYMTGQRNKFHPIKDYLNGVYERGWDGVRRVERLFVEYLGTPDTPYHRRAAFCVLVASVARVFEPGHKFDYSPVLQGPQGIRKSSFIEALYGEEYFGEMTCNLRDTQRIAEQIGGLWGVEFPELASFYKSDHNDAKQFLSAKEDRVRMAYDRRVSIFPRQATFWGTTNDKKYLKDPTGNRRWWPIVCRVEKIDTDMLRVERDQLWAEAVMHYRRMRREQEYGSLPLYLRDPDAEGEALALQEEARAHFLYEDWLHHIEEWLETPLRLSALRAEYAPAERFGSEGGDDPLVLRVAFRLSDAAEHAIGLEGTVKHDQMVQNLDKAVTNLVGWSSESALGGPTRRRLFGVQGRWKIRDDATKAELEVGYRIIPDDYDDVI